MILKQKIAVYKPLHKTMFSCVKFTQFSPLIFINLPCKTVFYANLNFKNKIGLRFRGKISVSQANFEPIETKKPDNKLSGFLVLFNYLKPNLLLFEF